MLILPLFMLKMLWRYQSMYIMRFSSKSILF